MSTVLDFILGSSYPEETAYVYTGGTAAHKLLKVKKDLTKKDLTKTEESKLKKEAKALKAALDETRLEFHFKGLSPAARDTIFAAVEEKAEAEGWDEKEKAEQLTGHLYAAVIDKVLGPDGNVMEQKWSPEAIIEMFKELPEGATADFIEKANTVTVRAIDFDKAHDVGF